MTVAEMIRALTEMPADAKVVVDYDARWMRDDDLAVEKDGDYVVIVTDAYLFSGPDWRKDVSGGPDG